MKFKLRKEDRHIITISLSQQEIDNVNNWIGGVTELKEDSEDPVNYAKDVNTFLNELYEASQV